MLMLLSFTVLISHKTMHSIQAMMKDTTITLENGSHWQKCTSILHMYRDKKWCWNRFTWLTDTTVQKFWLFYQKTGTILLQLEVGIYIIQTCFQQSMNAPKCTKSVVHIAHRRSVVETLRINIFLFILEFVFFCSVRLITKQLSLPNAVLFFSYFKNIMFVF